MATDWYMEGPWFKNCNCDPGCPCDFNQFPTHDHCEGAVAMRIDQGNFGDVDLTGLHWAGTVRWPGAMHEGNGESSRSSTSGPTSASATRFCRSSAASKATRSSKSSRQSART